MRRTRTHHSNRRRIAAVAVLGAGMVAGLAGFVPPAEAVTNGTVPTDTRITRATVRVNAEKGCTGTLVTLDTVLTAGHCYPSHVGGATPARDWESPTAWYTPKQYWLGTPNPPAASFSVAFGNDVSAPDANHRRNIVSYSTPGGTDMMLFKLDRPFGADVATPIPALTRLPAGTDYRSFFFSQPTSQPVYSAGYGGTNTLTMAKAKASSSTQAACTQEPYICATLVASSGNVVPVNTAGDSGGPLYWTAKNGSLYVIAEHQGDAFTTDANTWGWTATMSPGAAAGAADSYGGAARPDLRTYLERMARPRQVLVGDVTGGGTADLVVLAPDRQDVEVFCAAAVNGQQQFNLCGRPSWMTNYLDVSQADQVVLGDVTGDGRADLVTVYASGTVIVYKATGTGPTQSFAITSNVPNSARFGETAFLGAVDSDHCQDLLLFANDASGDVNKLTSTCSGLSGGRVLVHDFFAPTLETPKVIDVNGDGKDDLVTFVRGASGHDNSVWVALSDGIKYGSAFKAHSLFASGNQTPYVGRFNWGPYGDIMSFDPSNGGMLNVGLFNPSTNTFNWNPSGQWSDSLESGASRVLVGDVNGDGLTDVLDWRASDNHIVTMWSNGNGAFTPAPSATMYV